MIYLVKHSFNSGHTFFKFPFITNSCRAATHQSWKRYAQQFWWHQKSLRNSVGWKPATQTVHHLCLQASVVSRCCHHIWLILKKQKTCEMNISYSKTSAKANSESISKCIERYNLGKCWLLQSKSHSSSNKPRIRFHWPSANTQTKIIRILYKMLLKNATLQTTLKPSCNKTNFLHNL